MRRAYTEAVQVQTTGPSGAQDEEQALLAAISRTVRGLLPPDYRAVLFGSVAL